MLRDLRYLAINASIYTGMTVLFGVVVLAGAVVCGGTDNLFGTYLGSFSIVIQIIFMIAQIGAGGGSLDMALGMGSRRRSFAAAAQVQTLACTVFYTLMQGIFCWQMHVWLPATQHSGATAMLIPVNSDTWLLVLGIYLIYGELGLLCGTLLNRSGNKVVLGLLMAAAMVAGMAVSLIAMLSYSDILLGWVWSSRTVALCLVLAGVAMGVGSCLAIQRYSVR